jgi:hypothetical protein
MDPAQALTKAASESGLSADFLYELSRGLDSQAFLTLMGNASSLPSKIQSSVRPQRSRMASAPSSESRLNPASHSE